MEECIAEDEVWNVLHSQPPVPDCLTVSLNPEVKQMILQMREKLYQLLTFFNNFKFLDCEAAVLSRILYRNHRALKKDKGFQLLKMVMTSLKKYLKLDIPACIGKMRTLMPVQFSLLATTADLPTQSTVCWFLTRLQALAALFYRIFHLTKRCGLFIYQRLRLDWNPGILVLSLCVISRIHVIARYLVLEIVNRYSSFIKFMHIFPISDNKTYESYPKNLKKWLGGLKDLDQIKKPANQLDAVFDLIDLTDADEDFFNLVKEFGGDQEVECIYQVINLEPPRELRTEVEDLGEIVYLTGQPVIRPNVEEDVGEVIDIDNFGLSTGGLKRKFQETPGKNFLKKKKKHNMSMSLNDEIQVVDIHKKKKQKHGNQSKFLNEDLQVVGIKKRKKKDSTATSSVQSMNDDIQVISIKKKKKMN